MTGRTNPVCSNIEKRSSSKSLTLSASSTPPGTVHIPLSILPCELLSVPTWKLKARADFSHQPFETVGHSTPCHCSVSIEGWPVVDLGTNYTQSVITERSSCPCNPRAAREGPVQIHSRSLKRILAGSKIPSRRPLSTLPQGTGSTGSFLSACMGLQQPSRG